MNKDKKIKLINDVRLNSYTKRLRSGKNQVFYTGNDHRDFVRYKKDQYDENGKFINNVKMHDKKDTITIIPPKNSWYSDLIDGQWWWVEGCSECNGKPRDWMTYVECDKHDVCSHCRCDRKSLTEAPWGRQSGWVCKPCADREHEIEKREALSLMPEPEDYDECDYICNDNIKCPHCNLEFDDDHDYYEADLKDIECPRCDNTFTVTAEHSVSFTCQKKPDLTDKEQ